MRIFRRVDFSLLQLSNCGEPVSTEAWISCALLTEIEHSQSTSGFEVLCIQRCLSVHRYYMIISHGYYCHCPVSLQQSVQSPLTSLINKAFLPTEMPLAGCFFLSSAILCKLSRRLCVKIPGVQQFLRNSNQPVWHQQPNHSQSHLDQISSPS